MKFSYILLFICFTSGLHAQISKEKLTQNINAWCDENAKNYTVHVVGKDAAVKITRYHPERADEEDDILEILYEGMKITLMFDTPLSEITTHQDSLQNHFSYVAIHNIYNEIPSKGWNIYPRTPQSSLRGKGVNFTSHGNSLGIKINWSTFSVMGHKDSKKCNDELSMADGSISNHCYVSVRKSIPLEILISDISLKN